MTKVTTRPAESGDIEAVAALFDAYRQFYEMPADLRSRAGISMRGSGAGSR